MFSATSKGWHIKPTTRSEAAKLPTRTKDGQWRSWVFLITTKIRRFPKLDIRENKQLTTQDKILVMKTVSLESKCKKLSSKKKQLLYVLFMIKKVCFPNTGWSSRQRRSKTLQLAPIFLIANFSYVKSPDLFLGRDSKNELKILNEAI